MNPQNIRVRKALVIFLGVVIALGMAALLVTIGQRIADRVQSAPVRVDASKLVLPPGASVVEMNLDGDRIALRLNLAGGGQAIHIFDLRTGAPVGVLALAP